MLWTCGAADLMDDQETRTNWIGHNDGLPSLKPSHSRPDCSCILLAGQGFEPSSKLPVHSGVHLTAMTAGN